MSILNWSNISFILLSGTSLICCGNDKLFFRGRMGRCFFFPFSRQQYPQLYHCHESQLLYEYGCIQWLKVAVAHSTMSLHYFSLSFPNCSRALSSSFLYRPSISCLLSSISELSLPHNSCRVCSCYSLPATLKHQLDFDSPDFVQLSKQCFSIFACPSLTFQLAVYEFIKKLQA